MTDHHKFRNKPTTQAWSTSMYLYNLLKEKEHSFQTHLECVDLTCGKEVYVSTPMHFLRKIGIFHSKLLKCLSIFCWRRISSFYNTQPAPCHYGRLRDDNLGWTQPAQYIELPGGCHFIEDKWGYVQVGTVLSHS